MRSKSVLDPEIATLWLRELAREWSVYNDSYLRDALSPPQFELMEDSEATLGTWERETRRIRISALHVLRDSWASVCETLRHEMAHQYADEVLRAHDEEPHGPAFRKGCAKLRISGRASVPRCERSSMLDPEEESAEHEHKIVATIRKLLALGESSNENEAAAAMRKARALLHKHKLDEAALEREHGFARRSLGACKGRHQAWEYSRSGLLSEFFFVQAIWVPSFDAMRSKRGSVLEIHGRRSDVELAAWVHDWLEDTIARLWDRYRIRRGLRGNRERQRYYDGLLRGLYDKLENERRAEEARGGALVPVHDAELVAHFRWLFPRIRHVTSQTRTSEAFLDGTQDGKGIELRKPVQGASEARRALPGS